MEKIQTQSKQLYNKAKEKGKVSQIIPFLELAKKVKDEYGKPKGTKSTGPKKVKFLEDKVVMGKDFSTGTEREEMEYIFEENGERKKYRKPIHGEDGNLHYFIEGMKDFNYGDELILEYIKKGKTGFIDIREIDGQEEESISEEIPATPKEEIPIIEEEEREDFAGKKEKPSDDEEDIDVSKIPF